MEQSGEVRNLVDLLGQAMARAIIADEEGQGIIRQIQDTGFEVGLMIEATVALRPKLLEDDGCTNCLCDESSIGADDVTNKSCEWSEEDRALMCNLGISLD